MHLLSANNYCLNLIVAFTFICVSEQWPQSNSDNNYLMRADALSIFSLYPLEKI
jgi:hypothetical protein